MKTIYEEFSEERKKLQEKGLLPVWFTTSGWQLFSTKYTTPTEKDFKSVAERISKCASRWTNNPEEWQEKFFNLIWNGWLSCSTPVLANMGTERGCAVSCSANYVADSVYDFYEAQKEVAVLSKNGFGTSSYLGDIRPRGSDISTGGKSSGVLPVLKDFIQVSRDISQGCYDASTKILTEDGYISFESLMTGHDKGKNIKVAIITEDGNLEYEIPTDYIKYEYNGDMIHFVGENFDAKVTPNHNMILVQDGNFIVERADDLSLTEDKFFQTYTVKSGSTPILVNASNVTKNIVHYEGYVYCVTVPPHRLMIERNDSFYVCGNSQRRGAWAGYVEIDHDDFWEIVNFINTNPDDCNIGWVVTDAFIKRLNDGDKKALSRYQKAMKTKMITGKGYFFFVDKVNRMNPDCYKNNNLTVKSSNLCSEIVLFSDKDHTYTCQPGFAPIIKLGVGLTTLANVSVGDYIWSKEGWTLVVNKVSSGIQQVNEYFTSSGMFVGTENHQIVQGSRKVQVKNAVYIDSCPSPDICVTDDDFLYFASIYTRIGTIRLDKKAGIQLVMKVNTSYFALGVFSKLCSVGFSPRIFKNKLSKYEIIIELKEDVLCFLNEILQASPCSKLFDYVKLNKTSHNDIGVISNIRNCGEHEVFHIEVDNKSHTYWTGGLDVSNCVLSSLNLSKYDEWKDTDAIFDSTVFLDCVASEFISMGKEIKGLEKAVRFTERGRALGLGTLGFHSYLQQKMIPFESLDAHFENINIFRHIREESEKATRWMAEVFGEPEWCKGYARRNTHLLAIAPNMSTAIIIGGVSQGIEPIYKNVFVQGSAAGELNRINPVLLDLMKNKNVYSTKNINEIINNNGSVQQVDWLTEDEKKVFKTAFEIDQKVIIRLAEARQKYIDQAQSINLFFSADESEEYISEVHQIAFNSPMIKSLYYIRSEAGVQASKGECEACSG